MSNNLPLPRLSPQMLRAFAPLCEAIPSDRILSLQQQIQHHLESIRAALHQNEFLDIALAEKIAAALTTLLAEYEQHPPEHQALIVGAARYFIAEDDLEPDTGSVLGVDDDARLLNAVLEALARPDLKVRV